MEDYYESLCKPLAKQQTPFSGDNIVTLSSTNLKLPAPRWTIEVQYLRKV